MDVVIVLLVPRRVYLRPSLSYFSKGDAKWVPVPRAVQTSNVRAEDDDTSERLVLSLMLPMPGSFEVKLKWAEVPHDLAQCRTLPATSPPCADHPLCFSIDAQPSKSSSPLLTSLTHQHSSCFGFPPKHPF